MANPQPPLIVLVDDDDQAAVPQFGLDPAAEDDEDDEEEDEEEDEDDDDEEEEEEFGTLRDLVEASRVAPTGARNAGEMAAENEAEEGGEKRRRIERCEPVSRFDSAESSQGSQWNRSDIDGLFCPICFDAWTSDGEHHICCLPCGHIYGMSCIRKWLQPRKNSGKCPQCNKKCTMKDVRKLFASRIVSVDEESQKRIRLLEAKCDSFEKKEAGWFKKEAQWRKRETELQLQVQQHTERTAYLEHLVGDMQSSRSGTGNANRLMEGRDLFGQDFGSKFCDKSSPCSFILEKELQVDGARVFDVDAYNQIFLISRKLAGIGGIHVLTKMSLIPPYDRADIPLPRAIKLIRDLHFSPSNSDLALFACLGKKLSVLSMESNNVILSYDLPACPWSCAWDRTNSHYVYAGLQNGSLLVFDMRQTSGPVESMRGLTNNPVHTVHSISHDSAFPSTNRTVLSASSIGLCLWNFGSADSAEEGPMLVPQMENQGVCISLAYCPTNDDIVASYRPKVEMSDEPTFSQPPLTPSRGIGQGTVGSHVHLKRTCSNGFLSFGSTRANVCDLGLPKSAIIHSGEKSSLFASEDKLSSELVLAELPSLTTFQRLKLQKEGVRDLKYTPALRQGGLLSCLSGDTMQLFTVKRS